MTTVIGFGPARAPCVNGPRPDGCRHAQRIAVPVPISVLHACFGRSMKRAPTTRVRLGQESGHDLLEWTRETRMMHPLPLVSRTSLTRAPRRQYFTVGGDQRFCTCAVFLAAAAGSGHPDHLPDPTVRRPLPLVVRQSRSGVTVCSRRPCMAFQDARAAVGAFQRAAFALAPHNRVSIAPPILYNTGSA